MLLATEQSLWSVPFSYFYLCFVLCNAGWHQACYIADDQELRILLPPPSRCWDDSWCTTTPSLCSPGDLAPGFRTLGKLSTNWASWTAYVRDRDSPDHMILQCRLTNTHQTKGHEEGQHMDLAKSLSSSAFGQKREGISTLSTHCIILIQL